MGQGLCGRPLSAGPPPKARRYHHHHGSPGHGADHLLPTIFAPSLVVPVVDGVPQLGTWQHVVLVDRNPEQSRPKRETHTARFMNPVVIHTSGDLDAPPELVWEL